MEMALYHYVDRSFITTELKVNFTLDFFRRKLKLQIAC